MKAGDIIASPREDGEWSVYKILAIDTWPDGSEVVHCLCYERTPDKPTPESIDTLQVLIHHMPVEAAGFKNEGEVIASPPLEERDLVGFIYYLKQTNFPRYLEVTQQDANTVIAQANAHYHAALALGEAGKQLESIEEYTQAVELFPAFYEAIDNRGLTRMELGDYFVAAEDFEASLEVNPNGHTALFSLGECYLKLGLFAEAEQVFKEGRQRFPEHRDIYLCGLNSARTQKAGTTQRPWWKFWG